MKRKLTVEECIDIRNEAKNFVKELKDTLKKFEKRARKISNKADKAYIDIQDYAYNVTDSGIKIKNKRFDKICEKLKIDRDIEIEISIFLDNDLFL